MIMFHHQLKVIDRDIDPDHKPQSEIYRRGNVENGWKSLIMVNYAWKCQ